MIKLANNSYSLLPQDEAWIRGEFKQDGLGKKAIDKEIAK